MGGVDLMDRMMALYPHWAHRTNKWTVRVLRHCFMLAVFNIGSKKEHLWGYLISECSFHKILLLTPNCWSKNLASYHAPASNLFLPLLAEFRMGTYQHMHTLKTVAVAAMLTKMGSLVVGNYVGFAKNAIFLSVWMSIKIVLLIFIHVEFCTFCILNVLNWRQIKFSFGQKYLFYSD